MNSKLFGLFLASTFGTVLAEEVTPETTPSVQEETVKSAATELAPQAAPSVGLEKHEAAIKPSTNSELEKASVELPAENRINFADWKDIVDNDKSKEKQD